VVCEVHDIGSDQIQSWLFLEGNWSSWFYGAHCSRFVSWQIMQSRESGLRLSKGKDWQEIRTKVSTFLHISKSLCEMHKRYFRWVSKFNLCALIGDLERWTGVFLSKRVCSEDAAQ
jgi:hypothetical protein